MLRVYYNETVANYTQDKLLRLLENANLDPTLKNAFISRVRKGGLSREENATSHICVYFAAYDPNLNQVFIGRHIKSGLWLFNGGHLDKDESLEDTLYREMDEEWNIVKKIENTTPSLFTLTKIEHPEKQICEWHYDIWYFIPFDKNTFNPSRDYLLQEFFEWGWKTIDEAQSLARDKATLTGIDFISNQVSPHQT